MNRQQRRHPPGRTVTPMQKPVEIHYGHTSNGHIAIVFNQDLRQLFLTPQQALDMMRNMKIALEKLAERKDG